MTAKVSLAIVDSALTPESPGTPASATRTFVPGEVENGNVHTFYENTTGSSAATRSRLTVALVPSEKVVKFKYTLSLPKAQTVDGIVKVAHVTRCNVEMIFPVDGTRDDRRDARSLTLSALTDTTIIAMISDLENLW